MATDRDSIQDAFLRWCAACGQKCCRTFGTYVSDRELEDLLSTYGKRDFFVTLPSHGQSLHVLKTDEGRCVFLTHRGGCALQHRKPLICSLYPLKYFWDGERIRWYVTLFCPAAKEFARQWLVPTYERGRRECLSRSPGGIQKLTSLGLLVEVDDESLEKDMESIIRSCSEGLKRNVNIQGDDGPYHHSDLGVTIRLGAGQQLWIDIEHRTYLQAQTILRRSMVPMNLMATELAGLTDVETFGAEAIDWGERFHTGFEVASRERNRSEGSHAYRFEYKYEQKGKPFIGIRWFSTKDKTLLSFGCEAREDENWKDVKRDFDEIVGDTNLHRS